jgi:hypothetical protein
MMCHPTNVFSKAVSQLTAPILLAIQSVTFHFTETAVSNDHAVPLNCKSTDGAQQMLDGSLAPKVPEFTKFGLMDYIVELIVCEDEVCDHDHVIKTLILMPYT